MYSYARLKETGELDGSDQYCVHPSVPLSLLLFIRNELGTRSSPGTVDVKRYSVKFLPSQTCHLIRGDGKSCVLSGLVRMGLCMTWAHGRASYLTQKVREGLPRR